jgi:hypothetical protein
MALTVLATYITVAIIAVLPTAVFHLWLTRWDRFPAFLTPIMACAGTCFLGYIAFWAFFFRAAAGFTFTAMVLASSIVLLWRARSGLKGFWQTSDFQTVLTLSLLIGGGYIGILCAPRMHEDPQSLAGNRFLPNMPPDNQLPRFFAERLETDQSPRHLFGDWNSSDRPPLQSGLILLLGAPLRLLKVDNENIGFAAGLWFQLLWVPALWALLRAVGATNGQAVAVVALTACTGFGLFYSVYTWPKFGAAAFVLGGVALILVSARQNFVWATALFGLAHLSHGGADFSILAGAVFLVAKRFRPAPREFAASILVAGILVAPWLCYQKYYDPPGNRLLKMHLAGVSPIDSRGLLATLRDSYSAIGWRGAWQNKWENIRQIFSDSFLHLTDLNMSPARAYARKDKEFFCFFRALSVAIFALIAMPLTAWLAARIHGVGDRLLANATMVTAWALLTLLLWALIMFGPGTTFIHQGSLAPLLVLFSIPSLFILICSRWWFILLALAQFISFVTTWWPVPPGVSAKHSSISLTVGLFCLAGLAWCVRSTKKFPEATVPGDGLPQKLA